MSKIEEIRIVLECRAKIVENVIKSSPLGVADLYYYKGKLEGYQQAIDLLNSSRPSIQVELRDEG